MRRGVQPVSRRSPCRLRRSGESADAGDGDAPDVRLASGARAIGCAGCPACTGRAARPRQRACGADPQCALRAVARCHARGYRHRNRDCAVHSADEGGCDSRFSRTARVADCGGWTVAPQRRSGSLESRAHPDSCALHRGRRESDHDRLCISHCGRRCEHHPFAGCGGWPGVPVHTAGAIGCESALSLLRSAGPESEGIADGDGTAPLERARERCGRDDRYIGSLHGASLCRDAADQHLSDRIRGGAVRDCLAGARDSGRRRDGERPHVGARVATARGGSRLADRDEYAGAVLAGRLVRCAVPVRQVRLSAGASVSVRRNGASRRGVLQRTELHLPRASDGLTDTRSTSHDLSRSRAPVVRRLRDDAVV